MAAEGPGVVTMAEQRACDIDDLPIGEMMGVRLADYDVILLNAEGEIHAYYGLCPHALGRLAEGEFDGCELVCGIHLWTFDAATGHSINPTGASLTRFPVRVDEAAIFVSIPDVSVVDWRQSGFLRSA